MTWQQYLQKKLEICDNFLQFIDGEKADLNFDHNILKNRSDIIETIHLLLNISQNHHRGPNFYNKIKQILDYFLDQIKQIYSVEEIYSLFKNDRIILVYLFEKGILVPDQLLLNFLKLNKEEYIFFDSYYFYPEVKSYDAKLGKIMEKNLLKINPELLENFEEKRRIGENETYICSLIREDLIEEFVKYTQKTNFSLLSIIKPSIFETNPFLIKNDRTSLIEYAAFYGSIQIYQYLKINNAKFTREIWYYAIHGNNPNMIHQIESDVSNAGYTYELILAEAIKCHHNNLAVYIQDNLLSEPIEKIVEEDKNFYTNINSQIFGSFNFKFFPDKIDDNELYFYYACYYDYVSLVKFLFNTGKYDICKYIILNDNFFYL